MFEQPKPTTQAQQPSMKKPEDMFAATDPVAQKHSNLPLGMSPQIHASRPSVVPESSSKRKNLIVFLAVIVVVGVAVGAVAYVLTKRSVKLPEPAAVEQESDISVNQGEQETVMEQPVQSPPVPSDTPPSEQQPTLSVNVPVEREPVSTPIDQDQDGLVQDEEIRLGTSDSLLDTDLDGLSDWDEARVYKSNPLNADTDGDGYMDGHEVKNGYSPTGPGRLQEIPQQ